MNAIQQNVTYFRQEELLVDVINEFLLEKKKRSVNTYNSYKNGLDLICRDLFSCEYKYLTKSHLESLTIDELIKYFNGMFTQEDEEYGERIYSNSTINIRQTIIKQTIKYLSARRKVDFSFNVADLDVLIKSLPNDADITEALSIEDAIKYINHFREIGGEPLYLIGKLALNTGLRVSNILRLEWSQFKVNGEGEDVEIYSKKNKSKGNKEWENSISYDFFKELEQLKDGDKKNLFDMKYRTVANYFSKTKNHFGHTENYSFHSFRKTCLTSVYEQTNDIFASQQKGGHKSILTTQRYIKKRKYGAIELYSNDGELDKELYKKASHEELLEALGELDSNTLFLINSKLNENLNKK